MKLSWHRTQLKLAHSWKIARTTGSTQETTVIAEITAADGTIGRGEAAPVARYKESPDSVEAFLKKVDPRGLSFNDVEGSMSYLETISDRDPTAKCALNLALLDGAGKRAGKPIYDLLGLGFKDNHHVSSFSIGIDTPEMIRKKVIEAEKFPILKVKVGGPGDKETLKALREVAPEKMIRVDGNEGWKTKEQALENIQWLATDGHIQYVEQPMPAATSI